MLMSNLNPHGVAPPIYQSSVWAVPGPGSERLIANFPDQVLHRVLHCSVVCVMLRRQFIYSLAQCRIDRTDHVLITEI